MKLGVFLYNIYLYLKYFYHIRYYYTLSHKIAKPTLSVFLCVCKGEREHRQFSLGMAT